MGDEPERSEIAFRGHVVTVARERWAGIDHDYDVVRNPGAAAVLPVTADGDAILVRQFRPPIRRSILEIPAGLLDVDGEDALTCAARELFEETGHRHVAIEFLGGIYPSPGVLNEYVHLFRALVGSEPEGEPEPGIEIVRRPLVEMAMAARAGRVRDAKTALALLMTDGRPPLRP